EDETIFVDNTLSINHLKQSNMVQSALGKALDDAKLTNSKMNQEQYQMTSKNGVKRISHIKTNTVIAELKIDIDNTQDFESNWLVTEEFIHLAIETAQQKHINTQNNDVDQEKENQEHNKELVNYLFKIDKNDVIKHNFIEYFNKEVNENA